MQLPDLHLGRPITRGALTVFPLWNGGAVTSRGYDVSSADEQAARLVGDLKPLPFQSGVLLCIAGQPTPLEVFDSPRTLATVWDALLHAAAIDALTASPVATPGRRARRFLERVRNLSQADQGGTDDAQRQRRSLYAELTCLTWRERTVHAVAVNPRHELVMS